MIQDTHTQDCRKLTNPESLDDVRRFLDTIDDDYRFEVERNWGDRTRIDGPEFIGVSTTYGHGDKSIFIESNAYDYSIPLAPDDIERIWAIPPDSDATMLPSQSADEQRNLLTSLSKGDRVRLKTRGTSRPRIYHVESLTLGWNHVSATLSHATKTYHLRTNTDGYSVTGIPRYEDPDGLCFTLRNVDEPEGPKLITNIRIPPNS